MPGELHKKLVAACHLRFPELIDGDKLKGYYHSRKIKGVPIPDLSSSDKTLAEEGNQWKSKNREEGNQWKSNRR